MTAIKHTLQRQVFLPCEERLISVVHVTKPGKKKKASFLCAAVTTEKPIQAFIYQVKKSEKDKDVYKKKLTWALRELRSIDAKYTNNKDCSEFDMLLDKSYKWVASSLTEKYAFIQTLWKLSQRYLVQKPDFISIPPGVLEDFGHTSEVDTTVKEEEDITLGPESDWHALTHKEETDLNTMMDQCDSAISNAEVFADQLSKDLSVLDGANIHSIMGSEDQVMELMVLLDQGLQEAIKIEEKLEDYDQKLQSVKDLMEIMKDKDYLIQIRNKNHEKLLDELDGLISQLDLDTSHMRALLEPDLSSPGGIRECTSAAKALLSCMQADIHIALNQTSAVKKQKQRFEQLKSSFAKRLAHYLNNFFIHQGNELGENLSRYSTELKLPQHSSSHRDLLPYAELMHWLKAVDADSYIKLKKVYTTSLSKLYDREVHDFIESVKQKLGTFRQERKGVHAGLATQRAGSSSSLNKTFEARSAKSGSVSTLDSESQRGSDPDVSGRHKADQMFEHVLSELGPVCLAEQDFCVRFFNLVNEEKEENTDRELQASAQAVATAQKKGGINDEMRKMMLELFPSLETELNNFINFVISMDNFNSLYMLVRMSQHVINAEDTGSFLSKTLGNSLVQIKRNFDKFVKYQLQTIRDSRTPRKSRTGVIPFVHNFEDFAHQAESIFRGSDRRTDLDKAYVLLVRTIFEEINRIAAESQKTPSSVVMMAVLSRLKITCLELQKKEAKQKYLDHLHAYVTSCMGRPMEKLHLFFEGIEVKLAAGVKDNEVGYQLAYSKQELRKVIKEYPGKEVKRGLDHLYRKMDKQLSEEENLLQVVWHSMQEEFIKQYKHFEDMIKRCYKDAGIMMDFTIADILSYFSDIAQSH